MRRRISFSDLTTLNKRKAGSDNSQLSYPLTCILITDNVRFRRAIL